MQRLGLLIFSVAVLAVAAAKLAAAAPAPTDSRQALEAARAAYQAGNFDQARDLALKASQTDPKNPEAHLLLGMARYQLGELDEAIAAWKRTLQLAPEEPYAKKMLAVLRGQAVAIDTRIKLIEEMLRERLLNVPLQECKDLLADKALSDAQRAKVMTLQAEILIRKGKHGDANVVLQTLLALYPQQADPLQTTLLLGQAKLRGDEESRADAVKLLGKLIADHPDTPAAKAAQYELAIFELQKGVEPARVEALANWLAANKDHELANDARRRLLVSYLQLTTQGSRPSRDADLSPTDVKALGLAAELCRPDLSPAEAGAFGGPLIEHIQKHYLSNGAQAAALKATETLLGLPLPRPWRLQVLELQASCQLQIATRWLGEEATAGRLPQAGRWTSPCRWSRPTPTQAPCKGHWPPCKQSSLPAHKARTRNRANWRSS
jgi:tetratricopeptide (TPR) repeat protein